jgi:hypothetical protein
VPYSNFVAKKAAPVDDPGQWGRSRRGIRTVNRKDGSQEFIESHAVCQVMVFFFYARGGTCSGKVSYQQGLFSLR